MKALWDRIEHWASEHRPGLSTSLNPGASQSEIEELAAEVGRELPAPFAESLAIHNGEAAEGEFDLFPEHGWLLSVSDIIDSRKKLQSVRDELFDQFDVDQQQSRIESGEDSWDERIKPVQHFSDGWVPFIESDSNCVHALDLDPAPAGVVGQVIAADLESGEFEVVSDSFEIFLSAHVDALEAGDVDFEIENPEPVSEQDRLAKEAWDIYRAGMTAEQLGEMEVGTEVDLIGFRHGSVDGDLYELSLTDDIICIRGSLRGARHQQPLRVRVRVGEKPKRRHDRAIHEIVEWEALTD